VAPSTVMHVVIRYGLVVAALAACHSSAPASPDAAPDAFSFPTGLVVKWTTKQPIPGDVGSEITVASATFSVDNLRVIGDAGPRDPPPPLIGFEVDWADNVHPFDIPFPAAPSGLYSKVAFELDGLLVSDSIDIAGTVRVGGNAKPFEIHDHALTMVSLN